MHHGSISEKYVIGWREALYDGRLKAVVCTSSLDLGVDFRPVDAVIQIGSPKGLQDFSKEQEEVGIHQGKSTIYFLPNSCT